MEWNRAKTILIVVFLLINIFLGTYLFLERYHSQVQTVTDLTDVLARNGIELQMNTLPYTEQSLFVPGWNTPVLTEKQIEELISSPVETGDGYTNPEKTCRLSLSNNQFYYQNTAPNEKSFHGITEKNAVSKLRKTLKTLGVDKWVYPMDIVSEKDAIKVRYGYQIDQKKLFGSFLTMTVCSDGIVEIEGFLGIPDLKNGFSYRLSNIETILMSLTNLKQEGMVVTDIELGYYLATYKDALVSQAIPVFEIHTSKGSMLLDARDGVQNSERNLSSDEKGAVQ